MREARFKETEIGTIPEDWAIDTLGSNVDKIFCGRDPSGGKQSHSNERTQYRIIQSAPVFDGYLNNEKVGNISKEMYHNLESASLRENDVLLNQLGDGITFARSCVVSREVLPAIITRSVGCIRCNQQKLDPWFLNAFLILPKTKKYIESFNSGSSRRAIDGGKMRSFLIPIPPIEEQRKIGFFYKTIQSKLELNRSMNSTLEAIGQALFRRWFVDFEFPNEEGKPYRSSGGEMVETELGEVPVGWKVMTAGEVLELAYGKALKDENRRKGNVPVYGSNGQIGWHDEKLVDGPGIVVGRKGNPGIVTWSHTPFFSIDTTFYVVPKTIRSMYYLFYVLRSQDLPSLGADSAVPGLNRNIVYMNKMIVPSSKILDIFDAFLRKLYNKVQDNNKQSDILTEIRDALLPKLMSGEIRTSKNSNLNNKNK